MDKLVLFVSCIDGCFGTYQGNDIKLKDKDGGVPLYKAFNSPFKKHKLLNGMVKIPESCILKVDVPINNDKKLPGQPDEICFIIPNKTLPGITYEKTIWSKLMSDLDNKTKEANTKIKQLESKIISQDMEIKQLKSEKHQQQTHTPQTINCSNPSCNARLDKSQVQSNGGMCPHCNTLIN